MESEYVFEPTKQQKKVEKVFGKYSDMIKVRSLHWYIPSNSKWSRRKVDKFLKYFAIPLRNEQVMGLLDCTLFKTGKEGFLFTYDGIFIKETLSKLYYIAYDKVKEARVDDEYDEYGYLKSSKVVVSFLDGSEKIVFDYDIRKYYFVDFLNEVVKAIE